MNTFQFFSPNLFEKGFRVGNWEKLCWNKNQDRRDTLYANFRPKWTTLSFSVQICPKMDLVFEIPKANVGTRISDVGITCIPIFRQNGLLWLFRPEFAQKWILGSKFQKSKSGFRINTSNMPCVTTFSQNGRILIFRPNFKFFYEQLLLQKTSSGCSCGFCSKAR